MSVDLDYIISAKLMLIKVIFAPKKYYRKSAHGKTRLFLGGCESIDSAKSINKLLIILSSTCHRQSYAIIFLEQVRVANRGLTQTDWNL